jgi:hypothetical protein
MKTALKTHNSDRLNGYTLGELRATIIKAEKLIERAERDAAPLHKRAYQSEIRIELVAARVLG